VSAVRLPIDYASIERKLITEMLGAEREPVGLSIRRRPSPHDDVCEECLPFAYDELKTLFPTYPLCDERRCPSAVERLGDLVR